MSIDIQHIAQKYATVPLVHLADNEAFVNDIISTGENKSRFLVRRFSFRKPRISIRVDNPEVVHIDMVYGLNNRSTILSIEREIISIDKDTPLMAYVKSDEETLESLEGFISMMLDIKGWKFPSDMRNRQFKEFLTEESPYSFDLRISIDTLSVYGEAYVSVILDYIDINDAIKLIKRADPEHSRELDVCYNLKESNVSPLAIQYRDFVNGSPHVQSDID